MTDSETGVDRTELLRLVVEVSEWVRQEINSTLADEGLTEPMVTMLWMLQPGSTMSMRQLADKLNYDPSNITLLTDKLVGLGLVERQPHPTDGRRRVIALTETGQELYMRVLTRLFKSSPVFALPEEDQRTLIELLSRIEATRPDR